MSRSNTVCGIRVLIAGYGAATRWIFQLNDETIITSEVDYARTFWCFGEVDHNCVVYIDVAEGEYGQVAGGNGIEGEGVVGVGVLGIAARTHEQYG